MKKFLIVPMVLAMCAVNAFAGAPTCSANSGGYCSYTGAVEKIYVNSGGLILLYFDTSVTNEETSKAGITISNGGAAAYLIDSNPDFSSYFYSTALAAQASGREVTIQMRNTQSGYLKFDRIWLSAP